MSRVGDSSSPTMVHRWDVVLNIPTPPPFLHPLLHRVPLPSRLLLQLRYLTLCSSFCLVHFPSSPPSATAARVLPPKIDSPPSYRGGLRPPLAPAELSPLDLLKLRRAYPNRVKVPSSCLEEGAVPWNFALVGKFLGRSLSIDSITSSLLSKWVLEQELELIPLFWVHLLSFFL